MLIDSFNRQINYLRLSITDMCNLRCIYCQPWHQIGKKTHRELLSYEEVIRLTRLMSQLGIKRIRITGGEPLIRRNILYLLKELGKIELLEELCLTTNGTKLSQFAWHLKDLRVKRLNISLDSLDKDRYSQITGGGNLSDVLFGIKEALNAGLVPLKINVVIMQGINDDEIVSFARLTLKKPLYIRFIEFMPISQQREVWTARYIPSQVLKERLSSHFTLIPINGLPGNTPVEYYKIKGAIGGIGFISPISDHFCSKCNRLRLTPDGHLRLCLGDDMETDLKTPLRNGTSDDDLKKLIKEAVRYKSKEHQFRLKVLKSRSMSAIGG